VVRKRIGETEIHGEGGHLGRRHWRPAKESHNAEHHFVREVAGCCAIPSQKPLRQDALAGGRDATPNPETNDSGFAGLGSKHSGFHSASVRRTLQGFF